MLEGSDLEEIRWKDGSASITCLSVQDRCGIHHMTIIFTGRSLAVWMIKSTLDLLQMCAIEWICRWYLWSTMCVGNVVSSCIFLCEWTINLVPLWAKHLVRVFIQGTSAVNGGIGTLVSHEIVTAEQAYTVGVNPTSWDFPSYDASITKVPDGWCLGILDLTWINVSVVAHVHRRRLTSTCMLFVCTPCSAYEWKVG